MGHLRKITMEEVEATGKIGATESADYSSWHLLSLDACMSCGRCMEVCPAYGAGKGLNPKQVVADLFAVAGTDKPVTEAMTEEALWSCTTCHACVEACPVLIRHVDLIVDGRRNLVAEGKLSGSSATMLRQVGSTGHAWGEQPDKKEEWMKGLDVPLVRNGVEYDWILWVGCAGATDPAAVKTTQALAKLLKKAGVKFACLGKEESCTGDPARRVGDEFTFQEMQGQNQTVFDRYGIKKIVTACPHCLNTFRNEYGDFGADLEVWHHTQLLAELGEAGKRESASPGQGEVTYHDPCYLARVNNESNAPRLLVGDRSEYDRDKAAIQKYLEDGPEKPGVLAEPEHRAHKTLCCGAGGGMMWMDDDPESRPSSVRINELVDTGAKTVAVSCPFCRIMLDAGLSTEGHDEINLVDMAELLAEANEDK
jgi:Fe-S oxidoreductase